MNGELSGGKSFSTADVVLAFSMLLIGFFYWNLINIESLGFGVTLFTAISCTAVIVYFNAAGFHQTRGSLGFLGILVLSAANFVLFDGILIKALNFLFLSGWFVYWVCSFAGNRLENKLSIYMLSDMLHQLFVTPFCNFTSCFAGMRQIFVNNKKGKGVFSGVIGILFFLPVLILVISLLINADAAFESLMGKIRFTVSENMILFLRDIILGLPVACYLYGLIYGNRYGRNAGNRTVESVDHMAGTFRIVPDVAGYSALTALSMVYVIFFLAQTAYLFSAFQDSLPHSMTYAEYARRGFFELCAVSGINLGVIAAAHLFLKRDKIKILKVETAILCIFTIALIATAMSKMAMYIDYYGLTRLRVYTSWFMILLLFLFVIILFRQIRSFNGTRIAAIGCICLFMLLCYGNADGMIAKYNIDRYQSGTLEELDVKAFSELSDGAVPYLYDLYSETTDPGMKAQLKEVIKRPLYSANTFNDGFRDFNLQSYKANELRRKI
jgi:hypothetical protein